MMIAYLIIHPISKPIEHDKQSLHPANLKLHKDSNVLRVDKRTKRG